MANLEEELQVLRNAIDESRAAHERVSNRLRRVCRRVENSQAQMEQSLHGWDDSDLGDSRDLPPAF